MEFQQCHAGNSSDDRKNGTQSVRITSSGKIVMLFDKPNGAGTVTVHHALFGSDAESSWQLMMSTDKGKKWIQVGASLKLLFNNA